MTTSPPRFGVLLLHGFTGNPDTMRPLQAPLEALGVQVSLPLLQGHGASSPQALMGVTWADWLADGAKAPARQAAAAGESPRPDPGEPGRSNRAGCQRHKPGQRLPACL